jgi:anti-anti-sigma factor
MSLKITMDKSPTPTLKLVGRLDTDTAPQLDGELNKVLGRKDIKRLVFDLSGPHYWSSVDRCFVRARKAVEPGGGTVAILNPQPGVRKVLDIVKAIPAKGIFASVAELDEYLDAIQKQIRDQ